MTQSIQNHANERLSDDKCFDSRSLRTVTLRFHYRALGRVHFDVWPGMTLRSRLGYAIHQLFGEESEVFQKGFRHAGRSRAGYILSDVPHLYKIEKGQSFLFKLILLGEMIQYAEAFAEALLHLEKTGLAYSDDGKPGQWELLRVIGSHGADWSPQQGFDLPVSLYKMSTLRAIHHVLLIPRSPIRLSEGGLSHVIQPSQLTLKHLLYSAWQRIAYLNAEYDIGIDIVPEAMPELENSLSMVIHADRFIDDKRFISGQRNLSGGFLNTIELKGNLSAIFPLLDLGSRLHIGEHSTYGLGEYALSIVTDSDFTPERARQAWDDIRSRKMTLKGESFNNAELTNLSQQVQKKKYSPPPLIHYSMSGGREISVPALSDRIIQRWAADYLNRFFDDILHPNTYGYRKGRGAIKAVRRAIHEIQNEDYHWAMHLDIQHYFDSIDRHRLNDLLYQLPIYHPLRQLIIQWVENGGFRYGNQWEESDVGIGQGNIISPFLSNLYLTHFDTVMNQFQDLIFIRYSDDFILLARSKEIIAEAFGVLQNYLQNVLSLSLHDGEVIRNLKEDYVSFLGIDIHVHSIRMTLKKQEEKAAKMSLMAMNKNPQKELNEYLMRLEAYYGQLLKDHWVAAKIELLEIAARNCDAESGTSILIAMRNEFLQQLQQASQDMNRDEDERHRKREQEKRRAIQDEALNQTLIINKPYAMLRLRQGSLLVEHRDGSQSYSLRKIKQVIISSSKSARLTTPIIIEMARRKINMILLDGKGEPTAYISGRQRLAAHDIIQQLEYRQSPLGMEMAQRIIIAKTRSQLAMVKYYNKSRKNAFAEPIEKMSALLKNLTIQNENWRKELLNYEANMAAWYWNVMKQILNRYEFPGRKRKGATDPMNSALNYGYGILLTQVNTAIARSGLFAEIGLFHADQYGKPTLAYDIMEMYRQPFIDRPIFSMAAKAKIIEITPEGYLSDDSRKAVISAVIKSLHAAEDYLGIIIPRSELIQRQVIDIMKDIRKNQLTFKPYFMTKW